MNSPGEQYIARMTTLKDVAALPGPATVGTEACAPSRAASAQLRRCAEAAYGCGGVNPAPKSPTFNVALAATSENQSDARHTHSHR